jgi:hypothetical protein
MPATIWFASKIENEFTYVKEHVFRSIKEIFSKDFQYKILSLRGCGWYLYFTNVFIYRMFE